LETEPLQQFPLPVLPQITPGQKRYKFAVDNFFEMPYLVR